MSRHGTKQPEQRHAPEPEGPEEISRRFQKMNRSGVLGKLRDLAGGIGKKSLYGAFAILEILLFGLGAFFEIPFMETIAMILLPLFVTYFTGSEDDQSGSGENNFLERLLKRLGDPLNDDDPRHTGGR